MQYKLRVQAVRCTLQKQLNSADCWPNMKEKRFLVNNNLLSLVEVLRKQLAETCVSCRF